MGGDLKDAFHIVPLHTSNYNWVWFKTPSGITGHFICLPMSLKDCPIIFDLISIASNEIVKFLTTNGHILNGDYDLELHGITQIF